MNIYEITSQITPTATPPENPQRIIIVRPCCIGDVVMATAALMALRRAYPDAQIDWAVGSWSRQVIEGHTLLDGIIDLGNSQIKTATEMREFVRVLRAGSYDLAVSLVRSPRVSLALTLTGIPYRAGLHSAGRGFGYNIRAIIDPVEPRHEVDIYLDVVRALGIDVKNALPTIPVQSDASSDVLKLLAEEQIMDSFIVVNVSGGNNPGARMDEKRYPPSQLAHLLNRICPELGIGTVIAISGPEDEALVRELAHNLKRVRLLGYVGALTFPEIAALALLARGYIGNDTGLTHLAAAVGALTVMILGPTDPVRYRPYAPNAMYLWKEHDLPAEGAAKGAPVHWDWQRHGISPEDATDPVMHFLEGEIPKSF